jgi:hypothetical protein
MSKISQQQVEAAVTEMARQDITFANCDASWQKRTMLAALEAALSIAPTVSAKALITVEEYVDGYCWRGDEGDYTPNEHEKALLIDALHGAVEEVSADFVFASRHNDGTGQCESVDIGSTTLRKLREKLSAQDCEATP